MRRSFLILAAALVAASLPAGKDQWSAMTPVPAPVGPGGGIVRAANGDLYVLCGNRDYYVNPPVTLATTTKFYRCRAGTWAEMAPVPGPVGLEGGLAHCPGTNHVYVILGNRDLAGAGQKFLRYSISDDVAADETR